MAEAGEKRNEGGARRRKPSRGKKPEKSDKRIGADGQKGAASRERAQLIWAIGHPLRRRILRKLGDKSDVLSPNGLSIELNCSPNITSYHVRVLNKLGAVKQVDAEMVRGALEHFYVSTIRSDPPIEALLAETGEVDEEGSE